MSTIWLRTVDDKPANRPVPHRAKKVEDLELIAVQSVDIKYFNRQTKTILASLERSDGTAQTDFDIFGPGSLSVSDLNTLRFWKQSSDVMYSLGLPFDIESSAEFQSLCGSLLKTSQFPEGGRPLVLLADGTHVSEKRDIYIYIYIVDVAGAGPR